MREITHLVFLGRVTWATTAVRRYARLAEQVSTRNPRTAKINVAWHTLRSPVGVGDGAFASVWPDQGLPLYPQ